MKAYAGCASRASRLKCRRNVLESRVLNQLMCLVVGHSFALGSSCYHLLWSPSHLQASYSADLGGRNCFDLHTVSFALLCLHLVITITFRRSDRVILQAAYLELLCWQRLPSRKPALFSAPKKRLYIDTA